MPGDYFPEDFVSVTTCRCQESAEFIRGSISKSRDFHKRAIIVDFMPHSFLPFCPSVRNTVNKTLHHNPFHLKPTHLYLMSTKLGGLKVASCSLPFTVIGNPFPFQMREKTKAQL